MLLAIHVLDKYKIWIGLLLMHFLCVYSSPVIQKGIKPTITNLPEIKKEVEDIEYDKVKTELSLGVNEDVLAETEEEEENESKKELDLDSIDMMQLPIQLDDGIDILDNVK